MVSGNGQKVSAEGHVWRRCGMIGGWVMRQVNMNTVGANARMSLLNRTDRETGSITPILNTGRRA